MTASSPDSRDNFGYGVSDDMDSLLAEYVKG
jgi:hypothetical protein